MRNPILVWPFYDAPQKYKDMSRHGGDEDWIAVVPAGYENEYIGWMDEGTSFGCCCVSEHKDGTDTVYIGAHA